MGERCRGIYICARMLPSAQWKWDKNIGRHCDAGSDCSTLASDERGPFLHRTLKSFLRSVELARGWIVCEDVTLASRRLINPGYSRLGQQGADCLTMLWISCSLHVELLIIGCKLTRTDRPYCDKATLEKMQKIGSSGDIFREELYPC